MTASAMNMLLPMDQSGSRPTRTGSAVEGQQHGHRPLSTQNGTNRPLEASTDGGSHKKERETKNRGSRDGRHRRREPGVGARSSRVESTSRDTDSVLVGSAQALWDRSQAAGSSSYQKSHSSSQSLRDKHVARGDGSLRQSPTRPQRRVESWNSDFDDFGSWCKPPPTNSNSILEELENEPLGTPRRRRGAPESPLGPAPMSTDFAFYPCSGDEEDRIGEEWYMEPKSKMNAQLEWAMAYIEDMRSGGAPRPIPRQG